MPDLDTVTNYLQNYVFSEATQNSQGFSNTKATLLEQIIIDNTTRNYYINEYWTSRQRQAASIHEISYRACFKPQLPRFFIELLTLPGDTVYDPFSGRGTTAIETALLDRRVISNDINPLSKILTEPRLEIPPAAKIIERLNTISIINDTYTNETDLSMFYHPQTEQELLAIRQYLDSRKKPSTEDSVDRWIRMVATNRLTGHSRGFFSVYTMPPNQALSADRQVLINRKLNQKPEYRNVKSIIIKKTRQLIRNLTDQQKESLREASKQAVFLETDASETTVLDTESINLTVTSPPFLDVVHYCQDNWLRFWFNNIDISKIEQKMTVPAQIDCWASKMNTVFKELYRITKPSGWVAFEVGEVKKNRINLEKVVIPLGTANGFTCAGVVVNQQQFTKTSNIWGISNNHLGTNSNRIVLFCKMK